MLPNFAKKCLTLERVKLAALLLLCVLSMRLQAEVRPSEDILRKEVAASIYGIEFDAKREKLYVAEAGPQARQQPSRVLQLNPESLAVEKSIDFAQSVFDVVLSKDGSLLYAVHTVDNAFSVVDLASASIRKTVKLTRERTPQDRDSIIVTRKMVVDDRNKRLFLAETTWPYGALFVVNANTLQTEKIFPNVGLFAMGMALDTARNRLFIANMDHEILVFDTQTLAELHRWKVNVDQPLSLAYDGARNLLYVSDQGREYWTSFMAGVAPHYKALGEGNKVLVVNAENGREIREIKTEAGPLELLLGKNGETLHVTQRLDGSIATYDTATGKQIKKYPLPIHPNSMAVNFNGRALYATIKDRTENEAVPESVVRIRLD